MNVIIFLYKRRVILRGRSKFIQEKFTLDRFLVLTSLDHMVPQLNGIGRIYMNITRRFLLLGKCMTGRHTGPNDEKKKTTTLLTSYSTLCTVLFYPTEITQDF